MTKSLSTEAVARYRRDGFHFPVRVLSSDQARGYRDRLEAHERALGAFKAGTCRVLVATDIAARGIDIDGVTHVINFELPNVPESYVHRIGRTARAGASGIAISLVANDEKPFLRDIERLTRVAVPVLAMPEGFVMPRFDKLALQEEAREEARERAQRFQNRGPRPQRDGEGKPRAQRPRFQSDAKPVEYRPNEHKPAAAKPARDGQAPRPQASRSPDARSEDAPRQNRPHRGRRPGGNRNRPQGASRVA